jgi:CRP-like cAMP-binding protein
MPKMKIFRPSDCSECRACGAGIFSNLDSGAIKELAGHRVINIYRKGQTLFIQGTPPFGLYCINVGKIKITHVGPDGRESIVRLASAGDVVGHRSLFSEELYSATATALEDTVVCFFDKQFVQKLVLEYPSIAYNIIAKLGRDLGQAEKKIASLNQKSVPERLAELLLHLKVLHGVKGESEGESERWMLDVKLTREEMASMIGTASETLIRFISEFKESGLLEQEGKTLYLKDIELLKRYANVLDEKELQ